jgi:hypothetical protein
MSGQHHAPAALTLEGVPKRTVQSAEWAPWPVCTHAEKRKSPAPTGIRTQNGLGRSQSLYRLGSLGSQLHYSSYFMYTHRRTFTVSLRGKYQICQINVTNKRRFIPVYSSSISVNSIIQILHATNSCTTLQRLSLNTCLRNFH